MRKLIYILTFCVALSATHSAQAQSFDALLNSLSSLFGVTETPPVQEPKEVYPSVEELSGRFAFDELAIEYKGDSSLASLAVATLESQLPLIAEKLGLIAGRDYMNVAEDGSMMIVRDNYQMPLYCSVYDSATGEASIMLRMLEQDINIKASVTKVDSRYRILFDAREMLAIIAEHYSKFNENTTLQMVKGVIDAYPGVRVGAFMRK